MAELLTRRYRHLQLGVHANPPIAPEVASAIYARFAGELRGFLGLLGAAVRAWAPLHPGQPMTANDIIATAGPVARQELIEKIGENDTERLQEITDGWPFDAEFRVADIQRRCSITQAGASKLAARLADAGVIAPTRRQGKSQYYVLSGGPISIALGIQ
ncbi:MAG: hypothetical protein IT353_14695 [Gemmatimonadaceae bacterium]|nr:hypothetical protein [Gemmatimonadaceae bacterium]